MSNNITHLTGRDGEKTGIYMPTPKAVPAMPASANLKPAGTYIADSEPMTDEADDRPVSLAEWTPDPAMTPKKAREIIAGLDPATAAHAAAEAARLAAVHADEAARKAEFAAKDRTVRHLYDRPVASPTVSLKAEKNSRGWNMEITVSGSPDVATAIAMFAEAKASLEATIGKEENNAG